MKLPNCKSPCKDCPFRKDVAEGWLGQERMREILATKSFVCHKNTTLQCAGHMLMKGEENDFVKLAGRLNIPLELRGKELVFETDEECISHHTW